jgi:hypothetical protein
LVPKRFKYFLSLAINREKYPRLARVLAARYQQSKRYGIIIEHFLIRFCYGIDPACQKAQLGSI